MVEAVEFTREELDAFRSEAPITDPSQIPTTFAGMAQVISKMMQAFINIKAHEPHLALKAEVSQEMNVLRQQVMDQKDMVTAVHTLAKACSGGTGSRGGILNDKGVANLKVFSNDKAAYRLWNEKVMNATYHARKGA